MPITEDLKAAGVDVTNWQAIINYIAALPVPRDRREGLLRLAARSQNRAPTLAEIEQVRALR